MKHANKSFADLVSKKQIQALQPMVFAMVSEASKQTSNELSKNFFQYIQNLQTRIMALEKVLEDRLGVSEEDIIAKVVEIEDSASGHTAVSRGAQEGDLVRVTISTKSSAEGAEFTTPVRRAITNLSLASPAFSKAVDAAILGMTAGETKEITVGEEPNTLIVRLTVDKVSESTAKGE